MKNKNGQSLIEVVFSVGIVILVLVGVVMLVVSTAKIKRMSSERQKAIELSQLMIEDRILYVKNNMLDFWNNVIGLKGSTTNTDICNDFPDYLCNIKYDDECNDQKCKLIFNVEWGDSQELSVERFFLRQGL